MPQVNAVSALIKFLQVREEKAGQSNGCTFKPPLPTAENQPESLINEAISLTSMDDCSIKQIRVREPINPYLHLARDGH